MPECDGSANCPNEARRADVGIGAKVCYPRAKVCVGDGTLCSPCRVDTDCGEDGLCVSGRFTTEKLCTKKVNACTDCPKSLESPARLVGCSSVGSDQHCVGLYEIGKPDRVGDPQPYDVGCWTWDR